MMDKTFQFIKNQPVVIGPVFLFCSIAIAAKANIPIDLLIVAVIGFFLSATLQVRGCVYSLILLGLDAAFKHALFIEQHLYFLGIELSFALAFFITALAKEQGDTILSSMISHTETQKSTIENLEDEIAKINQEVLDQQVLFQEKAAHLQKELEELQTEHSSILILNEVLRKTTAKSIKESDELSSLLKDALCEKILVQSEAKKLQEELQSLKTSDQTFQENQELIDDLNRERVNHEQTRLINETLNRLVLREKLKAQDADTAIASLKDQLKAAHEHIRISAKPADDMSNTQENEFLKLELERVKADAAKVKENLQTLAKIQTERNFLKERLNAATQEIEHLRARPLQIRQDPEILDRLTFAEEKMHELSQIEPLYRQLKQQFDEKNQVLSKTRKELFQTDTELKRIQIELSEREKMPYPKEICQELETLSKKLEDLENENRELEKLISSIHSSSDGKKK